MDPNSWEGNNGIQVSSGLLVIHNSAQVHGKIRRLLGQLRRHN